MKNSRSQSNDSSVKSCEIPMFAKDKTNDPMYLEKARELSCCDHSELIVFNVNSGTS